jgi:hypothetical protein
MAAKPIAPLLWVVHSMPKRGRFGERRRNSLLFSPSSCGSPRKPDGAGNVPDLHKPDLNWKLVPGWKRILQNCGHSMKWKEPAANRTWLVMIK